MLSVIVVSATTPSSAHCASSGFTRHSAIMKRLMADTNYICLVRDGKVRPVDGRTVTEVDIDSTMLDVEATFCYLGDMLCCRGDSDSIVAACCCVTCGKCRKFLPEFVTKHLSNKIYGKVYVTCASLSTVLSSEARRPTDLNCNGSTAVVVP